MAQFLATGEASGVVEDLNAQLAEAQRRSEAPEGTFAKLQSEALTHTLAERLGADDPFAEIRRRELWREVVFGGTARGDLPPSRTIPDVIMPSLAVGERTVDVALSGRVEFLAPERDGVATMVVVTDSELKAARLEDKTRAPGHQVLGPLLAWCALRSVAVELALGDALDVVVAYRKGSRGEVDLHTWRFEMTPEEGTSWIRGLLTTYLNGTACELLPYAVLVSNAELVQAVRRNDEDYPTGLPARIGAWIEAEQEKQHSPYRPPEFLAAVDGLSVPDDAWDKLLSRLGPVWGGRETC
jgi:hypothetical protein